MTTTESINGLREYKYYCIGEYKKTGDRYYLQLKRKLDKKIKALLQKEI